MHIQALVSADGILPVIISKLQLLFIKLASVPGGQLVNSQLQQYSTVVRHFYKITLTFMRKIILTLTIGLFTTFTIFGQTTKKTTTAQTLMTGYQYLMSTDNFTSFKYSRTFSTSGDNFITKYKIYHPIKGTYILTITARHFKNDKKVEIVIEDTKGGIFSEINKEETTYETPSMATFGFRGSVGALGGKKVPNQLAVKFTSAKFENVKIASVLGSHENNDFEFFVLDKQ